MVENGLVLQSSGEKDRPISRPRLCDVASVRQTAEDKKRRKTQESNHTIRTAGGEFLRNPITGMLEPILSVTIMDHYQHAPGTPGPSIPKTPIHYTAPVAQMDFTVPAPISIPQAGDTYSSPTIHTPLIDPELLALSTEYRTTSNQVGEGKGEEPVDDCNNSLFGDSPPLSVPPATAQLEYQPGAENLEDLSNFDISQYQLDSSQSQEMECRYAQGTAQTVTEMQDMDGLLYSGFFPNTETEADMDGFTDFDWLDETL